MSALDEKGLAAAEASIAGGYDTEALHIAIRAYLASVSPAIPEDVAGLVERLKTYRPCDEWGQPIHHTICDEAANALTALAKERDDAIRQHAVARENFHTMQLAADKLRQRAEAAEKERDHYAGLVETMVPIHADGSHVFIDGPGDVELDHGGKLRARTEAAEAETAHLKARLEEAGKAGDALAAQTRSYSRGFSGTLELGKALNAWDAARRFAEGER